LDYVKIQVKPDILFWTGDTVPHNVWDNEVKEVIDGMINITKIIKESFKGTNITVLPIEGNHDSWPANVVDFSKPNSNKVFNGFAPEWAEWLGNDTIK
jgi:hypothetical protein